MRCKRNKVEDINFSLKHFDFNEDYRKIGVAQIKWRRIRRLKYSLSLVTKTVSIKFERSYIFTLEPNETAIDKVVNDKRPDG